MAQATIDRLIINSPYEEPMAPGGGYHDWIHEGGCSRTRRQQMGSGIPAPLLARQMAF